MAELTVPQVDFSSLGQLPEIYRQGQANALRQQTLASLGQGGQADATALLKSGDLSLAQLGISMQNRQQELARQAQLDARLASNDKFSHDIQLQQLELSKRAAARADDKTPAGFMRDPSNPTAYVAIPGGPNDPSYISGLEAQKARAKGDVPTIIGSGSSVIIPNKASEGALFTNKPAVNASIDDETADFLAKRSLQGDTRALVGLGRGAQGAENILKIQQRASELAKSQGMDATDVLNNIAVQAGRMSESRTLGTKSANFGVAEKAMEESLPIALEASKSVPRTAFPALNRLIQSGQTNVGDPRLKKFLIATDTAAKDYARTINPSGQTREGDIAYARKLLSTADSPEAYEAALQQLKIEAGVTKRAIQRQKDEVQSRGKSEQGGGKPIVIDGYTIKEH